MAKAGRFEGWSLFWAMTLALGAMTVFFLATSGWGTESYRLVIRATARTSLALFLAAFLASALVALWPGEPTRWLRRNRRYLGLSFAMSHGIHLAAIVTLALADPAIFWTLSNTGSIIAGSSGYFFIALLAATSFDRMAAWLGSKVWQRIHTAGIWFIWISFVFTNGKRIPVSGWYAFPLAILLAAFFVRLAARGTKAKAKRTISIA